MTPPPSQNTTLHKGALLEAPSVCSQKCELPEEAIKPRGQKEVAQPSLWVISGLCVVATSCKIEKKEKTVQVAEGKQNPHSNPLKATKLKDTGTK